MTKVHYKYYKGAGRKPRKVPEYPKGTCFSFFNKNDIGKHVTVKWIEDCSTLIFSEKNGVIVSVVNAAGVEIQRGQFCRIRFSDTGNSIVTGIHKNKYVKEDAERGKVHVDNTTAQPNQAHILDTMGKGDKMSIRLHEWEWPAEWNDFIDIEEPDEGEVRIVRDEIEWNDLISTDARIIRNKAKTRKRWKDDHFHYYQRDLITIAFFGGMQLRRRMKEFSLSCSNKTPDGMDPITVDLNIHEDDLYTVEKVQAFYRRWGTEQRAVYSKVRKIALNLVCNPFEYTEETMPISARRAAGTYAAMIAEKRIDPRVTFEWGNSVIVDDGEKVVVRCSPMDYIDQRKSKWKAPSETEYLASVFFPGIMKLYK